MAISDEQLKTLLPALAEAERATADTAKRFVSPRTGILEEVSARRHQLVYGRRGAGKSTLLRRVAALGSDSGRDVMFIDIETLRRRPYPDVLIELLTELLHDLDVRLRRDGRLKTWKRRSLIRDADELSRMMTALLQEPQSAEHTVKTLRSRATNTSRSSSARVAIRGGAKHAGAAAEADLCAGVASDIRRKQSLETTSEAQFNKTKMDGLAEAAVLVRNVLKRVQDELKTPTLLVLDDFYHIRLDDQAEVLAYLHQIAKGVEIYLKVCGVEHRLKPYIDGDPPVGLEPGHDAGTISLDITLEHFEAARVNRSGFHAGCLV